MKCPTCGKTLRRTDMFCYNCLRANPYINSKLVPLALLKRQLIKIREKDLKTVNTETINFFKAYLVSSLRKREFQHLLSQEKLLNDLLRENIFTLVVLDACRYDSFAKINGNYLNGSLLAVKTPSSNTVGWLKNMFGKFGKLLRDVKIFSANPFLNSKMAPLGILNSKKYFTGKIIDVWKSGWSPNLRTVPPDVMVKAVEEGGLEKKNIIWFMQPHAPFLGKIGLKYARARIRRNLSNDRVQFGIQNHMNISKIPVCERLSAYEENLSVALLAIKKLLRHERTVKGRWIVTSDHGELLGEAGYYGHPWYLQFPEQRIVPWFKVNNVA